ncbi:MAG TPA: MlaD family protein [Thermoanaerobaculia bacterium]|nr:MlaD family protein [Thermoanaerobaculia bacterium]
MSQMIKVGLFATLCLIVLAVLIWNIQGLNPFKSGGERIAAVFPSVAGLDDKAAVRLAGVRVGRVDGIGLAKDGRSATVGLRLDRPVPLTAGTWARIANLGLLGDKYVELMPGPPGAAPLPAGAVLQGKTPPSFDDAMAKLQGIGDSIQKVTGSLGGGDLGGNINRLATDLQLTSAEIRALLAENRANLAATVRNFDVVSASLARELPRIAQQTQRALDQIAAVVAENRPDVHSSMENVKELTTRLQTSVDNLNHISGQVASGQGTVGKLINSEEAYNRAVSTLDSIKAGVDTLSGTIGAIQRFKFDLNLEGYALQRTPDVFSHSKSSFGLFIDPQDNHRFYKVDLSNTPEGSSRVRTDRIITTNPDGTQSTTTIRDETRQDKFVVTALLGFQAPYDVRLWGGLIESRGGAQIEYPLPWQQRRLWVSFEAFDFNRLNNLAPHLRLTGKWQFHPNLYMLGGLDDFLVHRALFIGGGIRWKDDNLKYLLGAATSFGGR